MKILFASSEIVPFAKTGGLGDVSGALPKELAHAGHQVYSIMPLYSEVEKCGLSLEKSNLSFSVPIADRLECAEMYHHRYDENYTVLFVEQGKYFDRPDLYGSHSGDYEDNAERFIFFSRAVLEVAKALRFQPDIIHVNDWQTGLVPVYLKTTYKEDPFFKNTASVFTIHNMAYQGIFPKDELSLTNLRYDVFKPEGIEYHKKINFLKGGLNFSEMLTTVSPTYCEEIKEAEFGYGLEGIIQYRSDDTIGIPNGIDTDEWNPSKDVYTKKSYTFKNFLGKWICKKDLVESFGLKASKDVPVIGIISRLTDQKGFDIISEAIESLLERDIQLIQLGTGMEEYEDFFSLLREKYPDKVGGRIGFDNELAHKIEAGSDIFLMPSKYEPCGLNQMYSMVYGTVPIVRTTGGLNDTVDQFDDNASGTGFKFSDYTSTALLETIDTALSLYVDKKKWKALMVRGMKKDFSWKKSAEGYISVYERALKKVSY